MSITKYTNDLFVSYAHIDNQPILGAETLWIDQFVHDLEIELHRRYGHPVSIWRDSKLAGSDIFDEVVLHHLRNSGLLLALLSPAYLNSRWSRNELKVFAEEARSSGPGLVVNDRLRILPILIYNVPRKDWPEELRDILGFQFYSFELSELSEPSGIGTPIDPSDQRYYRGLVQVAEAVLRCLRDLADSTDLPGPAPNISLPSPPLHSPRNPRHVDEDVFISYAREDAAAAQALARRLTAEDWQVFWDRSIPIGRTWDTVLEEKLDKVSSVVVLWSEASIKSEWVLVEANEAADRAKLVPIFIQDVKPPLRFRRLQGAQLVGWDHDADTPELQSVIQAIRVLVETGGHAS
jgi:hypothetical protein